MTTHWNHADAIPFAPHYAPCGARILGRNATTDPGQISCPTCLACYIETGTDPAIHLEDTDGSILCDMDTPAVAVRTTRDPHAVTCEECRRIDAHAVVVAEPARVPETIDYPAVVVLLDHRRYAERVLRRSTLADRIVGVRERATTVAIVLGDPELEEPAPPEVAERARQLLWNAGVPEVEIASIPVEV